MEFKKGFGSDNFSGAHTAVLEAISNANHGHSTAYGYDELTELAEQKFKSIFGQETEVFFVFNGTAANTLAIESCTRSYHSVICAKTAHINVDECGAPEKITGCKLLSIATANGKLSPEIIEPYLHGHDEHHNMPKVISITQPTEVGTVYQKEEIRALVDFAHQHEMYLHIDGARIANAAISLDSDFAEFTKDVGADILSFGGTKNGILFGEALVFLNPSLSQDFKFIRKQNMQLNSKMRFISAQYIAYLDNNVWKKNAENSNRMAQILSKEAKKIKGVEITQKTEVNGVFAIIPKKVAEQLMEDYFFYFWDENRSEVRWMCSFDTKEEEVKGFIARLSELMEKK